MTTVAGVDVTLGNFIGGDFRTGGGPIQAVVDLATTELLAEVPGSTDADVDAAGAAVGPWSGTSPAERSAALLAIARATRRPSSSRWCRRANVNGWSTSWTAP